jgi:hypothetical protein
MANLITHALSYSKESIEEYFITPLFVENDIRELITMRLDIKNSEKLDFFDNLEKITKAYAQGTSFTASTGVTLTQKTLSVSDMKAQIQQNGKAFLNQVKEALLKKGYNENDISDTLFEQIIMDIVMDGLKADLQRQIWFGDTEKEQRTSSIPNGSADTDYNVYDGFWKRLIDDVSSATIPAAQFKDLNSTTYLDTAAVAEVDTITLTGTAGTANITINGTAYLATFATDLTTTAANFESSHAATILAREGEVVVSAATTTLVVTSGIAGLGITTAIANVSGNLDGTIAQTTANVATGAIKTDGALAALRACYEAMPSVLRKNKMNAKFMVTASVADNYRKTLETGAHDGAQSKLVDGVERLYFRGVEVVEMLDWDDRIESDFNYYPHRILLTIPQNLVFGTDGASDDSLIEFWFEKSTQENNLRIEYKAGTQTVHEEYIVCAYA